METPNPGSDEAAAQGCICAVMDNHHGAGFGSDPDKPQFWITGGCPIHAPLEGKTDVKS